MADSNEDAILFLFNVEIETKGFSNTLSFKSCQVEILSTCISVLFLQLTTSTVNVIQKNQGFKESFIIVIFKVSK